MSVLTRSCEQLCVFGHEQLGRYLFPASAPPKSNLNAQEGINAPLDKFRSEQVLTGIQNPALTTSFRMTLLISELLITEDGLLNTKLIPEVIEYLQKDAFKEEGPKPYFMTRIEVMLSRLAQDSALLAILQSTKAPENPDSIERCNLMINATLLKPRGYSPTDRDARVALLKHLLDDPRQVATNTSIGDAVQIATSLIIPEPCLQDGNDLIVKGACFRGLMANTFPTFITSADLTTKISMTSTGDIQNADASIDQTIKIYDAPPIKAALLQAGIPSDDLKLNETVIKVLSNGQSLFTTDSEKVLFAYIDAWLDIHPEEKKSVLVELACYGFAALANSPTQRAITSIILAMCQGADNHYPTCWIVECITKTFTEHQKSTLKANSATSSWNFYLTSWIRSPTANSAADQETIEKVSQVFTGVLNKITSVQFEQIETAEHKGSYGTYRLYQKDLNSSWGDYGKIGKRISTSKDYQDFVQSAILDTQRLIEESSEPDPVKEASIKVLNQMSAYCSNPVFIQDSIKEFAGLELTAAAWPPLANEQKTPWNFGYFPPQNVIVDTWLGTTPQPEVKTLSYKDINQLIDWTFNEVIDINSEQTEGDQPIMYEAFCDSSLCDLAFNWLTDHPSILNLKSYMKETQKTLFKALDDIMGVPGLEVANTPINLSSLIQFFIKHAPQMANLDEDARLKSFSGLAESEAAPFLVELRNGNVGAKLQDFINSLKGDLTIHSVSNALVEFLNKAFNPNNKEPITNAIEGIVTIAVVRSLSATNKEKITGNAIHVADSNFEKTVGQWPRNAQLCFYFNPVTLGYGLAMITEGSDPFFYSLTRSLKNVSATLRNLKNITLPQ